MGCVHRQCARAHCVFRMRDHAPSEHLPQVSDSRVEPMVAQSAQSAVLQSLQRQVRERDRRIAELTFQLEALKTIDREAEARRQQGRFPGTRDR